MSDRIEAVEPDEKIRIFISNNAKMSRGKYAAHAVHAALVAAGVEYSCPVVVLGAPKSEVEKLATTIHDEGRTELQPGTLTSGTDWRPSQGSNRVEVDEAIVERVSAHLGERFHVEKAQEAYDVDAIWGTPEDIVREVLAALTEARP